MTTQSECTHGCLDRRQRLFPTLADFAFAAAAQGCRDLLYFPTRLDFPNDTDMYTKLVSCQQGHKAWQRKINTIMMCQCYMCTNNTSK